MTTRRPKGDASTGGLEMLLGRRAARDFLQRAWPDHHFVVHRRPRQLPPLFREGPLASFERLAEVYGGRVQVAGGRGDDHLQFTIENAPAQCLRRIGVTVFFGDDVSPYAPGGPEFLRSLEAALGAPQGIGAIRTFASAPGGGLEPHYDHGETFIVQLEGTKELRLARNHSYPLLQFIAGKPPVDEHYAEYTHGFPTRAPPDEVVVTLEPGSVLFIPRGMWHRTEASDTGPSYSASICIDTPAPADLLLSALRLYLRQAPDWRRPAYGAWGPQRAAETERLRGLLHDLAERLPTLSAEGILDGGAPFDLCASKIDEGRRFQRVPTTRLEMGKGLRLRAIGHGGREVEIQLNRALLPVAHWLRRRDGAFCFGELRRAHPKLERSLLTTLVQSLVAAEALRWLPFDAYDVTTDVVIREVGR